VDAHREAFFVNFAQIRPPQAHLALSAELIGAHSDLISFHLTFEDKGLRFKEKNRTLRDKRESNYDEI